MRILFCNIAWMKYYRGKTEDDIPVNGGSYVDIHQDGHESHNFTPITVDDNSDEGSGPFVFGFFETKCTNGETVNQVHIEKIDGCSSYLGEDCINQVLVIWCATSPSGGESKVVGWYKNATVYRNYQGLDIIDGNTVTERCFNVKALASDAVLLPEGKRNRYIWNAPRKNIKNGTPFGFFRSNVWYASEEKAQIFIKRLVDNINAYSEENAINWDGFVISKREM